ncbi:MULTISPECIES: hypothetical protein [Corynebacterium]|uniref:Uncharacterized protein n=1 Tax=Corynebacterium auriscanis TaxID=99807 RepID=A0A0A2DIS9_9CORY|nr:MULTISPECIES: hypothetical protein [Corynebacterium]KGM19105.1 hypothetical protein MA47_02630 [Corynebacterium auriscanis]OFT90571.1 hypothetical protein HMPREF3098_03305 [Corynebacterium sp. HMSC28B08]WJY72376.1 hypothetical protein CAURIC_03600 [Corynebacterium auriscanis]
MNSDIRWGLPSDGHTFPIYAGPADDMDRVAEFAQERGVNHLRFGGDTWALHADEGPEISAQTGTGTWTATALDAEKFSRAKNIEIKADRHTIRIINEAKQNFVLDIDGEKVGQFTGDQRGLRNLHVEFEGPGQKLPLDVQIFTSWVARRCLEGRMLNANTAVLWFLAFIAVMAIVVWLGTL